MKLRILATGICAVLLASVAAAQSGPPPERERPWQDVELARIAADIYLLHRINDCQFTPQQMRKVIPVLEGVLGDVRRLRESVKGKLMAERRRLILGQEAAARPEDIKRMIGEDAARVRDRGRQALESTRAFLSPDQVQKLGGLIAGQPEGFFGGAARPPRWRTGPEAPERRPAEKARFGPNTLALERVVELLKEKLAA